MTSKTFIDFVFYFIQFKLNFDNEDASKLDLKIVVDNITSHFLETTILLFTEVFK
jgi:hypothetical protein